MITAWQHLRELVAKNANFLHWLAWVQQWAAEGVALPEARIAEARGWLDARADDIPKLVRKFIENSETEAEARLRELREARAHAEEAAREAEARRLAAASELALEVRESQRNLALVLAIESLRIAPTIEGDIAARHALRLPIQREVLEQDSQVLAVAFSPDGTRVATGSNDHSARVTHIAANREMCRVDHDDTVWAVAFSPDGTRVATGSHDRSARVFHADTGKEMCAWTTTTRYGQLYSARTGPGRADDPRGPRDTVMGRGCV